MAFDVLHRDIESDLGDLARCGRVLRADQLSAATGQPFLATAIPHYFTGDLAASLALVHLNPKQDRGHRPAESFTGAIPTVAEYLCELTNFGRNKYGPDSPRTHRSPFDHRQIRFLRPFGVIDFVPEDAPDAKWTNLQRSIDNKLQLEVIPYQSVGFSISGMTDAVLAPHYDRVLDTLISADRDYVIFCGRVFANLLRRWVVREHTFPLIKKDGTLTAAAYRFANLDIRHNGRSISAGLAPSYAMQGIPMIAYATRCAALYRHA